MNKREDILRLFRGEKPEYLPWYGDLAYWIDYLQEDKLMPPQYLTENTVNAGSINKGLAGAFAEEGLQKLHRDLGVGLYLQGYFPFQEEYHDLEFSCVEDPVARTRTTTFKTPIGELREVWTFLPMTYSWGPSEHLIKSAEDLPILKYIYEHTTYKPDYALAELRSKTIGDQGIVVVYAPKTPLMELVALKAGLETVVDLFMDEPDLLEETMDAMQVKVEEALEIALAAPADCIFFPENLSSEMVAGALYNNYAAPLHRKWTARAREAGRKSFVHLDGTLTPLLTQLSENGFDVIEAVTPMPVGDVAVEDLRSKVRPETIVWGGIPGGFFTNDLSDEAFDAFVIQTIEIMKKEKNFVLGVADQVVPGASFERIHRVSELIEQYGKL